MKKSVDKPVDKEVATVEAIGDILNRLILPAIERRVRAKRSRPPRGPSVKLAKPNRMRRGAHRRAKFSVPTLP
ncbi:MAG: hypothetical protein L6R28_14500 [Planctomycetes bacterium]|nr:hypothetical protein [Planctomycetota bacterium]